MKHLTIATVMIAGVLSFAGQERYKSGRGSTPEPAPSGYKLVTFTMNTHKGDIGAPMTLRFKDENGDVLFETSIGRKEGQVVRIEMKAKLLDAQSTEMVTVIPELVIGDEVVVPEHRLHLPAGMLERMKELKIEDSSSDSFCSQPDCGCQSPDGFYPSYHECACEKDAYQLCVYTSD